MWALLGFIAGYSLGALEGETIIGAVLGLALGLALDAWRKAAGLEVQLSALQQQVQQLGQPTPSRSVVCATAVVELYDPQTSPLLSGAGVRTDTGAADSNVVMVDFAASPPQPLPTAPQNPPPDSGQTEPSASADPWQSPAPQSAAPTLTWLQPLFDVFRQVSPLVLAGLTVLFLGLSFLATYFAHQGLLSMELRLGFIGLCGGGLVGLGWWKRRRLGNHAALLQGAGFAVVYLTLFAACKYYPMIGGTTAFALMLLTVLAGSAMALVQQSQALAILATAGGFLVPLLTSDGSNRFVGLFSYYLLLNAGVLLLAWYRQWRWLNWTGFVATFGIALVWQLVNYHSSDYALVQPFFAAYFLMYLVIGYRFTLRQGHQSRGFIDGSLVFGLPLLSFSQQLLLTNHFSQGDSVSAAVYALVYGAMYLLVRRQQRDDLRRFGHIQLGLALMFGSLVLPFSQGASWTAFGWALEARVYVGWVSSNRAAPAGPVLIC